MNEPEPEQRADVAQRGELVYWKSNRLGWFKGSCEPMILVSLVDAGTGHAFARFVPNNSAQEHFRILRCYIERWGRPREIRTGNASPFVSVGRDEHGNQIQRALHELKIHRSLEDRSEPDKWLFRFLQDAKQRLVPCLRQSNALTAAEANRYLEQIYLPRWNASNSVLHAANSHAGPPHRKQLSSSLSIVTLREIDGQNIVRYRSRDYQVSSGQVTPKGSIVRIENHLDDTVHFQLQGQEIKVHVVEKSKIQRTQARQQKPKQSRRRRTYNRNWMKEFSNWEAPPLWTQLRSQ